MSKPTRTTRPPRSRIARMTAQPSTWAGLAGIATALPMLIAAPANVMTWGALFASLAAVLKNEAGGV